MQTRFNDDPCRIAKKLEILTGPGRYMLAVPGNGVVQVPMLGAPSIVPEVKPCYMADPYIRAQKFAGNVYSDCTDLQSQLLGLGTPLSRRDCYKSNFLGVGKQSSLVQGTPTCVQLTTDQSRASDPAWTYRSMPVSEMRWESNIPNDHRVTDWIQLPTAYRQSPPPTIDRLADVSTRDQAKESYLKCQRQPREMMR